MKYLFFSLGCIFTGLGVIGIAIPVLPTTPFLILASLCFIRSSRKAYLYLYNHKHFGPYLRYYYTNQGVSKKEKRKAYIFLWIPILISIMLISSPMVRWLLLMISIAVTIHIARMKTRMIYDENI